MDPRLKGATFCLTAALALSAASGCRSREERQLASVVDTLNRSFRTMDQELAKAQYTAAAWSRPYTGLYLYERGAYRPWELYLREATVVRDRGVLMVDIARKEKLIDRIWLYCVRSDGKWLIEEEDETKEHPALFLEGLVPAHFAVNELPGDPELEKLGNALPSAALGDTQARATLEASGFKAANLGPALAEVAALHQPSVTTHVAEKLDMAVWIFQGWRLDIMVRRTVVIYLLRHDGRWRIVETGDTVSMDRKFLQVYRDSKR